MNYAQEIEQIEKTFREAYFTIPSVEELLTLAKKMQEEIEVRKLAHEQLWDIHLKDKWIPCSERLPEKEGTYSCTIEEDGERWVSNVSYGNRLRILNIKHDGEEAWSWITEYKVIAWMPLTEPFKGDL